MWEHPAQQTVVVVVDNPVNASRHPQAFDVSPEARRKIVTQSVLLRFIEKVSTVEILKGIFRDLDIYY